MTKRPVPSLVIVPETRHDEAAARILSETLNLPVTADPVTADLSLRMRDGVLSIRDHRGKTMKPLRADFESFESPSKKQLLGRAIGRGTRTVLDATAGWGDDTRRLCAMGYAVTAVERHPVMAALLWNAAQRAGQAAHRNVPAIVEADASGFLALRLGEWDCVYLDPMFPPKRRASALARRPMRLLRELAGDDADRVELFEAARASAHKRVVVKRHVSSTPLFGEPGEVVAGKLVCYDVYHAR